MSSLVPPEIRLFGQRCSEILSGIIEDQARIIDLIRSELPRLLLDQPLFVQILHDIAEGGGYPDLRHSTMFDNELFLYADSTRLFSLRLFLWDPGEYTPVHDHNSWGVIGPISGELAVMNYRREDDGSREGYAHLVETDRFRLRPGETAFTLPLDAGIHKTGNPTPQSILSLSLYGNPLPRDYIQGFDVNRHSTYHILSPKTKKRLRATRALHSLEKGIGEGDSKTFEETL